MNLYIHTYMNLHPHRTTGGRHNIGRRFQTVPLQTLPSQPQRVEVDDPTIFMFTLILCPDNFVASFDHALTLDSTSVCEYISTYMYSYASTLVHAHIRMRVH